MFRLIIESFLKIYSLNRLKYVLSWPSSSKIIYAIMHMNLCFKSEYDLINEKFFNKEKLSFICIIWNLFTDK